MGTRLIGKAKSTLKTAGTKSFGAKTENDLLALFQNAVTGGSITGVYSMQEVYTDELNDDWINDQKAATARAQTGGTMTLNSVSLGSYDYTYVGGNQTVSSFSNSDYFTTTADSKSALVYIDGDFTIDSGQVFVPSNRKLFTAIYVNGNLTVNGKIVMDSRGANHSPAGSPRSSANIKLINPGTYSGVPDPQIPSSGGSAGSGTTASPGSINAQGTAGAAGSAGGTGGGGGGNATIGGSTYGGGPSTGGNGSAGTSFSGGSGGGGSASLTAQPSPNTNGGNATSNGGKGGDSAPTPTHYSSGGGSGNPGGQGRGAGGNNEPESNGVEGTGGILIIYVVGDYSGSGEVSADGRNTFYRQHQTGFGGSVGGGSVTIFVGGTDSGPTPTAAGGQGQGGPSDAGAIPATSFYDNSINPAGFGVGGHGNSQTGGYGGAGTARKLSLTSS